MELVNLLITFVLIIAIQNLRLKKLLHSFFKRTTIQNIKTNIHNLINLIRLSTTSQTLNLTLQRASKDLLNYRTTTINGLSTSAAAAAAASFPPQLLEPQTRVVASINHVPQELVRVLLTSALKMLGKNPQTALDLRRRIKREVHAQRPHNSLLQDTKRTLALSLRVQSRITCDNHIFFKKLGLKNYKTKKIKEKLNTKKKINLTCKLFAERGVLELEAEIGEGRSVGEALKDAVEITRVAEIT